MEKPQSFKQKVALLMSRRPGLSLGTAQLAVTKALAFEKEAQAAAAKQAIKELRLTERAAATPPQRVHLRARARQIQAEKNCDLGTASLQAERERTIARAQAELTVKKLATSRQGAPTPRASGLTPAAPMPLANKGKTRLLSNAPDEDEGPTFLMVASEWQEKRGAN